MRRASRSVGLRCPATPRSIGGRAGGWLTNEPSGTSYSSLGGRGTGEVRAARRIESSARTAAGDPGASQDHARTRLEEEHPFKAGVRHPAAPRSGNDAPSPSRDGEAAGCQPHVPGDDRGRVLRRPATVRGRHAASIVALVAEERLGSDRRHPGRCEDLLFRTRTGKMPTLPNWLRAWHRSLGKIDHAPLQLYDCRHAAATTWLHAGVPLGEVARRLSHSVETLVSTYLGALKGDEAIATSRIDAELAQR